MDRRAFVAASVSAIGVATVSAGVAAANSRRGEAVRLGGWLEPAAAGPGHYFLFRSADGGGEMVVLPAEARSMRAGQVMLEGRLFRGKFKDATTGQTATAVITGARLV
ncbi:MAG TPA: hypothetical protein VGI95_02490 [Caulobacteraceae bacterium]|jgi:hypothetical protein